jgi:hypothetical protein
MSALRLLSSTSITLAWLVAASAGCTRESGDSGAQPQQSTGGSGSLPSYVSENPLDAAVEGSDEATPGDASPGGSPVEDAGSAPTGRQFPPLDYDSFPPTPTAPLCPSGGMLQVAPSETFFELGPSDAILGSVSPDGLSVAWTIPGSGSPGRSRRTTVFVADRASTSDAFGAPQAVDLGRTRVAPDKVALSPDGLRLVAVRSDQHAFVELSRSAATSPFGPPSEDSFAAINAAAQATQDPLGDPTIAGDDRAFFYTRALAVIESDRSSTEPWPEGTGQRLQYPLNPGQRPRLSAASEDHLTLFFWDDQRLVENAIWRITSDDPFARVVRLPLVPRAQPSASCTSLFFASSNPGGVSLAAATATFGP